MYNPHEIKIFNITFIPSHLYRSSIARKRVIHHLYPGLGCVIVALLFVHTAIAWLVQERLVAECTYKIKGTKTQCVHFNRLKPAVATSNPVREDLVAVPTSTSTKTASPDTVPLESQRKV